VASALAEARPNGAGGVDARGPFAARVFDVDSSALLGSNRWDEIVERNPDFVNLSETIAHGAAQNIDRLVYDQRIFVANGAGNWSSDPDDGARCWAYNSVCVGGYRHGGTASWADDTESRASWRNSPATGREEPDLAGPYTVPGIGDAGTSFATPTIVGLAALLTAAHPQVLHREPTLMRALLMASASHGVREPEKAPGVALVGDGVDDRTGAGVPRGDRASAMVEGHGFFARELGQTRDFASVGRLGDRIEFTASEGDVVRAVLAWDNCPVSQRTGDFDALVVDLDMTVRGPDHDVHEEILCCADANIPLSTATSADAAEELETGSEGYDPSYLDSRQRRKDLRRWSRQSGRLLAGLDILGARADQGTAQVSEDVAGGVELANPPLEVQMVPTVYRNSSRVDNYEVVEFTAPVGGTYEIEVDVAKWEVCPWDGGRSTHAAIAWDVQLGAEVSQP
jgi:hypothetical protein